MKNTKKIICTIGAFTFLLGIMLMPCINATIPEGKTMKTTTESQVAESMDLTGEHENSGSKPACFGSIYGGTWYIQGWGIHGLQFVLVKAEDRDTVIGKDRSNIFCQYKISRLPIGYTYTVTASSDALIEKDGKYYGFYNYTETITLTADKPDVEVNIVLEINYDNPVKIRADAKTKNNEEPVKERESTYLEFELDVEDIVKGKSVKTRHVTLFERFSLLHRLLPMFTKLLNIY